MTERAAIPPTVTFLFTYIEGSTSMWEKDPVRMAAALARHDDILRNVVVIQVTAGSEADLEAQKHAPDTFKVKEA